MLKLAARWILAVDAAPIENGVVEIDNGQIVATGPRKGVEAVDYGNAILMPGFVNAHTHIEYTVLRGFLEDVPFFPWVRALYATKMRLTADDWRTSARLGALECVAAGITTIGDNADAPIAAASAVRDTGLRAVIYQEVFGIDESQSVEAILEKLGRDTDANIAAGGARIRCGVSPHAPYTVRPDLFRAIGDWSKQRGLPLSIHIAESSAEVELTERGTGPFADMFKSRGIEWNLPRQSPTAYVAGFDVLRPETLAVHCVHQSQGDVRLARESGASIVHCPKSNAKLGAGIAPLPLWLAEPGLNVALGTDSAVSNNAHDMFEEMRFGLLMQRAASGDAAIITARDMVTMATIGGAKALGLEREVGTLTPGKRADIIAVGLDGLHNIPATDPYSALLYSARASDVLATYVGGELHFDRSATPDANITSTIEQAVEIRRRLSEAS